MRDVLPNEYLGIATNSYSCVYLFATGSQNGLALSQCSPGSCGTGKSPVFNS